MAGFVSEREAQAALECAVREGRIELSGQDVTLARKALKRHSRVVRLLKRVVWAVGKPPVQS